MDDIATINARSLQINPNNEYIFVHEIEKKVFKPDYNAGLLPNYEPPQIEEEIKQLEDEETPTQLPNMPAEE